MNITDLANSSDRASEFLKSLANAQRLRILCLIMEGERPVGEIAEAIGANQSSVSQNLALMRREGLVVPRRSGQTIYYRLADKKLIKMFRLLNDMFCQPGTD
ncbi:MAG TPA: metalloregulator ArsR/SmtB family transcription factor [Aestuariivirga sp.]|jgi:DNA-binding transcriptional ArsR family regulator|nr:metalloregulator ArsR/SmtB family transcription factor [Aestuariivirga sp.]